MKDFLLQNKQNMTKQKSRKLKYKSPEELRADHPDIDFDLIVTKSDFERLLAVYHYGDKHQKEKCQLLKKQEMCNTQHLNGWIAQTKTGAKGLIGRVCAKKHFGADEGASEFQLEANRLDQLIRIETAQQALKTARERWTADAIKSLKSDLESLKEKVTKLKNCLPANIQSDLNDRIKTGRTVVEIEIHVPEKNDKGYKEYKWHVRILASISGLRAVENFPSYVDLRKTDSALDSLDRTPVSFEDLKELKTATEFLNELDPLPDRIQDSELQFQLFTDPSNLELISILSPNHVKKISFLESVLALFGGKYFGISDARALQTKVDREIRKAHGGYNWRLR